MQSLHSIRYIALSVCLLLTSISVMSQDIDVDTQEIGTWFERNWIWVAAGVLLIILIAAIGRGRRRNTIEGGKRRTTTVIEDGAGNTKSVTTTEENL